MRDKAVAGREIDALAPFGIRHSRRHFLPASFRWRHDCFSIDLLIFKPIRPAGPQQAAAPA
jgi:hypothetical protein